MARERPPQEFVLAGWRRELWQAEDLLSRAEAFSMSGNALAEVLRARIAAAVGAKRAAELLPLESASSSAVPTGLDVATVSYLVGDVLRSIGALRFSRPRRAFTKLEIPLVSFRNRGRESFSCRLDK